MSESPFVLEKRSPATYIIHAGSQVKYYKYSQGQQVLKAVGGVREAQSAGYIFSCDGDRCWLVRAYGGWYNGVKLNYTDLPEMPLEDARRMIYPDVTCCDKSTPSFTGVHEIYVNL